MYTHLREITKINRKKNDTERKKRKSPEISPMKTVNFYLIIISAWIASQIRRVHLFWLQNITLGPIIWEKLVHFWFT